MLWEHEGLSDRKRLADAGRLAAACLGLAAEFTGPLWGRPLLWLPDLAVGLVLLAAGMAAWERERGTAILLYASGVAWFAGTISPLAGYWPEAMDALERGARKAGRSIDDIDRPQLVICSVDNDRKHALDMARVMISDRLQIFPAVGEFV